MQGETEPAPCAVNGNAIDSGAFRTSLESAAQQIHLVALARDSTENLVQMQLGAACLWVLAVLPVDHENPH
jgi:hypothetical protein